MDMIFPAPAEDERDTTMEENVREIMTENTENHTENNIKDTAKNNTDSSSDGSVVESSAESLESTPGSQAETSSGIAPKIAYVKSMDYLGRVLSETALTFKNLRSYQIGCAVLSVLLGLLLMRSFGNIFGLLAPIVGMNTTFFLYSRGVTKRLKLAEANAKYDTERLKQGKLDPRVFYKHIAEALTEAKKTDYLESLNGDTSALSPKEKARLSKYYES